jgi:two-component system, OmpR family, KDP operon response regulator KdpE
MLNMARDKILIVDDEPSIRRAIRATLLELGFDVEEASTGEQALVLLRGSQYEAMLLDINMPGMGGIEACRQIRQINPHAAILMLSVRDSEDDKVEALEAGADDYVTKPFHVRELVARVRAAIRRARLPQRDASSVISIGDIALDPAGRVVQRRGQEVHLTPKEFDLLHYLMAHAGLPIVHARLLTAVWGPESSYQVEYLRTFVGQLRKKLEDDAAHPQYLLTESQFGYRFKEAS